MRILNGVKLHTSGQEISGSVLDIENISIETNTIPVKYKDEDVGTAILKVNGPNLNSNITIEKEIDKQVIGKLYAGINGVVESVENGKITKMQIEYISLSENPNGNKTMVEYNREHKLKSEIGKLIVELRKKNWTERRIGRYMLQKYKIVLE